jgi:RluA family pseudouridine synthase
MALVQMQPSISRRKIRAAIDAGGVYVNDKRVRISSRTVATGDRITLEYRPDTLAKIRKKEFSFDQSSIVYEDQHLLAINKPVGLPSQATRDQSVQHVLPLLSKYLKTRDETLSDLILVHRLDKDTSGLLLIAKDAATATYLTEAFRERRIKKTYLALCHGIPKAKTFSHECHLSSIHPQTGQVRAVKSGGKWSHTEFETIGTSDALGMSIIQCHPHTGRSHQLRVHLASLGLPIIGDTKYGSQLRTLPKVEAFSDIHHHYLHAASLRFSPAPGAKELNLSVPPPAKFAAISAAIST